MPQKWNLQDIRPPEKNRERVKPMSTQTVKQDIAPRRQTETERPTVEYVDPDLATIDVLDGNSAKRKRVVVSLVIAALVLGSAFFINVLLGGATITVYPKFKDVTVQATFEAYAEPMTGELSYELLSLDATGERQVTASGQEHVSERAVGSILIYNTVQNATQRLIKNTRFETPEGLIFKIKESVEVPGATSKDGKVAPGVVTAEVFADGTGEQYNITPTRFTVPGLKGSDQYNSIYAENTNAFTGGFEGDRYIIDQGELDTAKQALHLELRNSLLEQLNTSRPSGFILYDGAVTFVFETLPSTSYGDSMATIKEKAYLFVPIFKDTEFAKYLAKNTIAGYENDPVSITDPHSLIFKYKSASTTQGNIKDQSSIEFTLSGNAQVVWQFDEEKLKNDLLGISKTALPSVLSAYTSIERAESVVRPFWAQHFPDKSSEMKLEIILSGSKPVTSND